MSNLENWALLIFGTLVGFVIGILTGHAIGLFESLYHITEKCKKGKADRESKRYEIERLAKRACDEMNDSLKLYSKAFNILWGTYGKVRVFVNASVRVRKDEAIVHFYVASQDDTKAKWAPELNYRITGDVFEDVLYWNPNTRDDLVDEMAYLYCKELRRYL